MLIMITDNYLDSDFFPVPVALSSPTPLRRLSQVLLYVHVKYKTLRFSPGPVRVY